MTLFRHLVLTAALLSATEISLATDTSLEGLRARVVGTWASIACELRPQQNPADPAAAPTPTYLTRDFTYDSDGGFSATITVYADPGLFHADGILRLCRGNSVARCKPGCPRERGRRIMCLTANWN